MTKRPVFLLFFANQQDDYLDKLKIESKKINNILSAQHDKQQIEVYREESTTIGDFAEAIGRFSDRICWIHYAGHAGGSQLNFEEKAGNAQGIAELLGQLPNLQMLFLNGCSTAPQVERLLNQGVQAVIATAVPIQDDKAVIFAENFYRFLSNNNSIERSFKKAVAVIKTIYGGEFDATIRLQGDYGPQGEGELMPWGLYLKEARQLQWQIPQYSTLLPTQSNHKDYEINHYLIDVMEAMIECKSELKEKAYNSEGFLIDDREILALIIEYFPWPIAVQIRLLATRDGDMDTASMERLKQIISTYTISSKFIFYIILSQIWDEKRLMQFNTQRYFLDAIYLDQEDYNQFDYFKNFITALEQMKEENCTFFVEEFNKLLEDFKAKDSELYKAYLHLDALRSALLQEDIQFQNIAEQCADAEYHLSTFLYYLAFLIRYDLITIRDIHVVNHKHLDTKFNHFIGKLNVKVNDLAIGSHTRAYDFAYFANNSSVILTPNWKDPNDFLNLSPFIIDKNAYGQGMTQDRATEQQLFMYAHRQEQDYKYFATIHNMYKVQERISDQLLILEQKTAGEEKRRGRMRRRRLRSSIQTEESDNPYEILKLQFELFEQDLLQ